LRIYWVWLLCEQAVPDVKPELKIRLSFPELRNKNVGVIGKWMVNKTRGMDSIT
jgi:hypothetical protein